MNDDSIVVNRPQRPTGLVLLFHGVGASAPDLVPIAQFVERQHPEAMVVSIDAPHGSALGQGREWFRVVGVTEENRPERVARALPDFFETVAQWRNVTATAPASTTLIGFSQGSRPMKLVVCCGRSFGVASSERSAGNSCRGSECTT